MTLTSKIKKLKAKMVSGKSKKYKSDRSKYALYNGKLKVQIQQLKNEKMERTRNMELKKHGVQKIKNLLNSKTLKQAITQLKSMKLKSQLAELLIYDYKLKYPDNYSFGTIWGALSNDIDARTNDQNQATQQPNQDTTNQNINNQNQDTTNNTDNN